MTISSHVMTLTCMLGSVEWRWLILFAAAGFIAVVIGGIIMLTVWLTGGFRS